MSMLEQSMMEMDRLANRMLAPPLGLLRRNDQEDDFFRDLPGFAPSSQQQPQQQQQQQQQTAHAHAQQLGDQQRGSSHRQHQQQETGDSDSDAKAFTCYSYSTSTVIDDQGRRIASTRRRYEDSSGRLKAMHERQVDDKRLKSIWRKSSKDDQGQHQTMCSAGSLEEFEQLWQQTPFGRAEQKHQSKEGTDHHPRKNMHKHKHQSLEGHDQHHLKPQPHMGVTKEAREKSREQAIAEQSKRQAEETTPLD